MLMETLLSTFDALSSRPLQRVKEAISRQKDGQPMTHTSQPVPLAFQFQLFADGRYCIPYMDDAIRTLYRIAPEHSDQELGKRLLAMVHPGDLNKLKASFNLSARNLTPWHEEYRLQFDDTPPCWLSGTALPQHQADGSVIWQGILTDITRQKQDEANLRIAATAFELQDAILVTDADGGILKVNQAFTRITGYSADEVIGQKPSMLSSGLHNKDFYAAMWESLNRTGNWRGEVWNRRKDGEIYPQWIIITAIKDATDKIKHYVASFSDISSRKAAEEEIRQMAFYDPLTQLPNRRLLQERLKHSIDVERRDNKRLAILMLDLDRFKNVNDSFGHLAGDELLQHVAARILDRLRDVDMVSRLGGDEFVVLLEDIAHPEDAARIAAEIIAELSHPFQLSQCSDVQIGTSIGISL
ncbi:MAG: diguanylate cyclase, partial [Methylobacter sp.]|nr:diguanylate cyclase [Methylobacter sp.]